MFSTPPRFLGLRPKAGWLAAFRAAVQLPDALTPGDVPVVLASCLTHWMAGSGALAADAGYSATERYCIRLTFLQQIYQAFEERGFAELVAEEVARWVLAVLEETPAGSRPPDGAALATAPFPEAALAHNKAVCAYYTAHAPLGEEMLLLAEKPVTSPRLPITSPGFLCTVVLPADMEPALARLLWREFLRENTAVRLITVGADTAAREAAETADPIFFSPGGGQKPGRCLWVQPAALKPDIQDWLRQQAYPNPANARCMVLRANGVLSSVLTVSDVIDDFAISNAFFNAC